MPNYQVQSHPNRPRLLKQLQLNELLTLRELLSAQPKANQLFRAAAAVQVAAQAAAAVQVAAQAAAEPLRALRAAERL
jgi:hypothetical protein